MFEREENLDLAIINDRYVLGNSERGNLVFYDLDKYGSRYRKIVEGEFFTTLDGEQLFLSDS